MQEDDRADQRSPDAQDSGDSPADQQSGDVRGGKGRKDEVGRSGIYPASAPNIPDDVEVITPGELGHRKG